ncbi:unnamed protein product [Peniophora sp. CBMAI 1063]|nr:unnamed protein product [Peniophora sp. CBMAI 1063]
MIHKLAACFWTCLALTTLTSAQFIPDAIPVAARSPYLLTYVPTITGSQNYSEWQIGYSTQTQALVGFIMVNGTTYAWAGDVNSIVAEDTSLRQKLLIPDLKGVALTPTRSIFTYQAGPVEVNVTFLSPIEPGNMTKQSIPAVYVSLDVQATDGASHDVQVYTDITAEWVSGNHSQEVIWSTNTTDTAIVYHSVYAANQLLYQEVGAQSAWGAIHYAASRTSNVAYRTGSDVSTRGQFINTTTLNNTQDILYRNITDSYPVFGFAHDLGVIGETAGSLVWAVANIRDSPSTGSHIYTDLSGQEQTRSLFYRSQYTDDTTLLRDFIADFPKALNRSLVLDERIMQAAMSVGGANYSDILCLATRQAYSGIEITVGLNATDGSVNASDVLAFYKDTGIPDEHGNTQVNPVDGLLSVFPTFLHLDAALCGVLLEPLLRFQSSTLYNLSYAALNLGTQYPFANASLSEHTQTIESSSGMIIMAYGHARAANDTSIVMRYYDLLITWADFLTSNTLKLSDQTSTDSEVNVALKGIIAIQAMSKISSMLKDTANSIMYSSQVGQLYSQWATAALAPDNHLRFSFNDTDASFSLGYNIFWDLALGTGLLDQTIIADHMSDASIISADWNMLAAAVATTDNRTQRALIDATHGWANMSASSAGASGQFPLRLYADNGTVMTGKSSPRQGAAYAPLLVSATSFTKGLGNSHRGVTGRTGVPKGIIIGATLGGAFGLLLLVGWIYLVRRRRSTSAREVAFQPETPLTQESTLRALSIALPPDISPFMEADPTRRPLSPTRDSDAFADPSRPASDAGSKRAIRLRRILTDTQGSSPAAVLDSYAAVAHQSTPPSTLPATNQGMWHAINSLRREVFALRMQDADTVSAPPEYSR